MCLISVAKAQSYNPDAVNKKAADTYATAIQLLDDGARREVIPVLQKAVSQDAKFVDAYLSLGGVYGELKDYPNSIANYEKAFSIDSSYSKFYLLPYSINLAGAGRFNDALNAVNNFLSISNLNEKSKKSGLYRKNCYEFAVQYAATHPTTIMNLRRLILVIASILIIQNIIHHSLLMIVFWFSQEEAKAFAKILLKVH